jgi:hypothetical protein
MRLAEPVEVLARGIEGGPVAEPEDFKAAQAAWGAHELLAPGEAGATRPAAGHGGMLPQRDRGRL